MKEIRIGLLGFGTVGSGVVSGLQTNGELLASRLGVRPVLYRIADLDLETDRGITVDPAILTTDASGVIADPEVDIIVELIGGTGVAHRLVRQALEAGKPVVTANKALLAKHGAELFALAAERGTDIYFGASVGGGIPVVRALREGLIANRVKAVYAILNGTSNYILTRMTAEGAPFDAVLADAQRLGYAEADPTLDVDGFDTAHKAVILAALSYGTHFDPDGIPVEGIRGVTVDDLRFADGLGYRVKLLAVIKRDGDDVEIRVHPALVPRDHLLAPVDGVFNAVVVETDMCDTTLYYGRGAGREPTASAVLADVSDIIRNLSTGAKQRMPAVAPTGETVRLKEPSEAVVQCYVRVPLSGGRRLADVTAVFDARGIAVRSATEQTGRDAGTAFAILESGQGREQDFLSAVEEIGVAGTVRLRIEGRLPERAPTDG